MHRYSPRRQSTRWRDGDCPTGVLAIYDDGPKEFERYTVFYAVPVTGTTYTDMWIGYRGMSEHPTHAQGVGIFGEMKAYEVAAYRFRKAHRACKWTDLPDEVRNVAVRDVKNMSEQS